MRELEKVVNSAEHYGNEVKPEPYFIERHKALNTRHKNLSQGLSVLRHISIQGFLVFY